MAAETFDLVKNSPQGGGYNYAIEQGATYVLSLTLYDSAGAVRDLTAVGTLSRMKIKQNVGDSTDIDSFTQASEITLASTAPNWVLTIAAAVTDAYDFNNFAYYDIEIEDAAGTIERVLEGKVELSKSVTK